MTTQVATASPAKQDSRRETDLKLLPDWVSPQAHQVYRVRFVSEVQFDNRMGKVWTSDQRHQLYRDGDWIVVVNKQSGDIAEIPSAQVLIVNRNSPSKAS
jgi:hypothetical protein